MKASLIALALLIPVGVALAQKEPGNESGKNGSNTQTTPGQAPQVKTKTFKGTLVDVSCAKGSSPTSSTTSPSTKQTAEASTSKTGEASRASGGGQSCDATASTTEFGLRTKDGHVYPFDSVGNDRAKQEMTAKKKWSNDAAAGKAISASVMGTETDDKLTVMSIH